VRRALPIPVLLCAPLAGCGAGSDQGVTLPKGGTTPAGAISYRGATSQRQRLTIQADGTALAKFRLLLGCKDGGHTGASIATTPHRPALEADGSFYYSESGTTDFAGFGNGRYRVAMAGQLQDTSGAGRVAFRIKFKSTTCRASVTWQAKRLT
jgi:hypothetical protein